MAAINKIVKEDCSGCSACMAACKKGCIEMKADSEGFLYPVVAKDSCNDCGVCETICPALSKREGNKPYDTVFAAKHRDNGKRREASSGGVFTFLAERVLNEGGIVCAARFDEEFRLIHDFCFSLDELPAYKGSKYVQSDMGDCFQRAKEYLKAGQKLLFVGTGCQVMGLQLFLGKPFNNLLTLEVVCHGVPSPLAWNKYLSELCQRRNITLQSTDKIYFRAKNVSWRQFSLAIQRSNKTLYRKDLHTDPFLRAFIRDLMLRPSCHRCNAKNFASKSDIIAGDYWGVDNFQPEIDDNKGLSFIMLKDSSLLSLFENSEMELWETQYANVLRGNPILERSTPENKNRTAFFASLRSKDFHACAQPFIKVSRQEIQRRKINSLKRSLLSLLRHLGIR